VIATLFDFDGVLVDSEPVHLEAFRDVVRPLGITITDEAYAAKYLGLDDYGAFRALLTEAHGAASEERIRALMAQKAPAFMKRFASDLVIFDGAREIVERRARLGPVGIVSGALESEVRYGLERMGVTGNVAFIVAAEACRACKPDPEGYLLALRKLPPGAHAVVVEDSIAGVEAGKAAGLRVAAIAQAHARDALVRAGADVVVPSIAALADADLDGTG
jgi:beta-phosphoglucomutase-like phosphatase (HAD superfamily)